MLRKEPQRCESLRKMGDIKAEKGNGNGLFRELKQINLAEARHENRN